MEPYELPGFANSYESVLDLNEHDLTIVASITRKSSNDLQILCGTYGASGISWYISILADGRLRFVLSSDGNIETELTSDVAVPDGSKSFIACRMTERERLVLVGWDEKTDDGLGYPMHLGQEPFEVGGTTAHKFQGQIHSVYVYSTNLSNAALELLRESI